MAHFDRYEGQDREALYLDLLRLKTCPICRRDLRPVAFCEDVYGCKTSEHQFETWFIPPLD